MKMIVWKIRRWVWDTISILIFSKKKVSPIPLPPKRRWRLNAIPISRCIPDIKIDNILMADDIPRDEFDRIMHIVFRFRLFLFKVFGPMQAGLPEIDADIHKAMLDGYSKRYRDLLPAPEMPAEFEGPDAMDLGRLAVASPYACFLERDADGVYHWDFRDLEGHEVHDGLYHLGCRVLFEVRDRKLVATLIECELGDIRPEDDQWPLARSIALASASNQISLVQHFNFVHLACGGPLAIATRNALDHDHAICRLIWPHMYATQNSNYLVTRLQLVKGGSFETMFSFTHQGLWKLYSDTYHSYRSSVIVPELDWVDRNLPKGEFDTPVQDNVEALYDVMHAHALRYVMAYYDSEAALRADPQVMAWISALNRMMPNGVDRILGPDVTRAGLARLLGGFIHMASVQHEALGAYLWDYQLWMDRNPVQVRKDGKRMPLDVFQKVINGNFNLNVNRVRLMQDFSYLALDQKGIALFWQFEEELRALELQLKELPHETWRILPSRLDANINA